ncbi:hypothetical protein BKA56DRAFT_576052 [Ilyonectria sp. MPI-CAGE-AT-0026]|nr:hypothetical protein BKA56DRAFT_576052 [Ilyonectria sp. MPI-CAGE-AT-0026]
MAFNQIPREIRQSIFEWVICSPIDPPASPSVSQKGRRRLTEDVFWEGGIWQLPPQNPALSLLLVNKQFHTEVNYVLQHTPTDYHVDIMFVKGYGLWTTWSIPVLPRTQYIDSVHATFRLFEPTDDLDPRFRGSLSFRGGDGGPPSAVWSFYRLLTALLTNGPGYLGPEPLGRPCDLRPRYVVNKVVVNVLAPTDGAAHRSIVLGEEEENRVDARRFIDRSLHDASIAPEERLARYMTGELDHLLALSYHTMNYGMVLYEGVVDTIDFLVNGEEYKGFNMQELVREPEIAQWGARRLDVLRRRQRYRKWRRWLDGRRRRMKDGLELDDNRPVTYIM